jgi:hypothetical protein
MDKGADTTQKIVIFGAATLALVIVIVIGYSLYTKAKRAEGELANKVALDSQTQKQNSAANISLTGEAKNTSGVTYDGLVQRKTDSASTTAFEIVNEKTDVEVPKETEPLEEALPPEESQPIEPVEVTENSTDTGDRPLTDEEILRIRQLPVDDSPTGELQIVLEEESKGEYRARY